LKRSRRAALVILGVGVILLLCFVFRSFVLETFVTPLAVVFWMFWRVLISIDQVYYWGLFVVAILAYLAYLFVRSPQRWDSFERAQAGAANAILENVKFWRLAILLNADEFDRPNLLKNNLGKMLVTVYNLKQPGTTFLEIHERLKQKQIDLPKNIYTFLYAGEETPPRLSLVKVLRSIRQAPARWLRHWSGRDLADYYQTVADVIAFMESLMEMDHDDTHKDNPANH